MRPAYTDQTNVVFVLHDPETKKKIPGTELPAERFIADDVPGSDKGIVHETTWMPDQGERRAIANGAPFLLRIWGTQHPPAQVLAGEPPDAKPGELRALMDERHVSRAVGALFTALAQRTGCDPDADDLKVILKDPDADLIVLEPDGFLAMWMSALEATADPVEQNQAADPAIDPNTGIMDLRTENAAMPKPPPEITDTDRAILDDTADRRDQAPE